MVALLGVTDSIKVNESATAATGRWYSYANLDDYTDCPHDPPAGHKTTICKISKAPSQYKLSSTEGACSWICDMNPPKAAPKPAPPAKGRWLSYAHQADYTDCPHAPPAP